MQVRAAHALADGADVVRREGAAQQPLEFFLADFTLALLRALLGLALQVLYLPSHVGELPFLLGVLEPVLLRQALLRFGNDPRALPGELPSDLELQVLLFPFELVLAPAQRQLVA